MHFPRIWLVSADSWSVAFCLSKSLWSMLQSGIFQLILLFITTYRSRSNVTDCVSLYGSRQFFIYLRIMAGSKEIQKITSRNLKSKNYSMLLWDTFKFETQNRGNFISRPQNKHIFIEQRDILIYRKRKCFLQNMEQGSFYFQIIEQRIRHHIPLVMLVVPKRAQKEWWCYTVPY